MATKSGLARSDEDLKSLYNVEATFEYTSRNGLERTLSTFPGYKDMLDHTVLITRFPPRVFDVHDNPLRPWVKKYLYVRDSQILILTIPSRPHEILALAMNELLVDKLKMMKYRDDLIATGAATVLLRNVSKQPDQSWGPNCVDYPTCVLEVDVSEGLRALDRDAQRWIQNEPSCVTQVITAKVYPHRQEMIFAVWQRTTGRQPVKTEEIRVEIREGQPTVSNNRCLHLFFKQLFERPPTPGTTESDVIFSKRELCSLARKVWEHMGVIPRG